MNKSIFLNILFATVGGLVMTGLYTHEISHQALNVCQFIDQYQNNTVFEIVIVLIIALVLFAIYMLYVFAMPLLVCVVLASVIFFLVSGDDRIKPSDVHIERVAKKECPWGACGG